MARCRCSWTHSRSTATRADSSVAARGAATNSWLLAGAPLLLAVAACSDPNRDSAARPARDPKPRDFRDARFYIDANANNRTGEDVDLARVILFGPGAFGGSREMVGWRDALSENDVRDLIAYIRTLGNGKRTKPDGAPP